jgi:hypothetical protein
MKANSGLFLGVLLAAAIVLASWFSGVGPKNILGADLGGSQTSESGSGW